MSGAPGPAQIWSLNLASLSGSAPAAPPALALGTWVVSHVLPYRLSINTVASQANAALALKPYLRGEGVRSYRYCKAQRA